MKILNILLLLLLSLNVMSKDMKIVSGYKDIKFGMTKEEVNKLGVCTIIAPSYGVYKCYGKYLSLFNNIDNGNYKSPLSGDNPAPLIQIAVGLGEFKNSTFEEYNSLLSKKYKLNKNFSNEDIAEFERGKKNSISNIYANGSVELMIIRGGNNSTLIDIVYNNKELAKKLIAKSFPKKDTVDDI